MFDLTRREQLIALILIGGIIVGGIVLWLRRDPAPPVPEPLDYEINLAEADRGDREIGPVLIDVNTAGKDELMEVPGIGPETADMILERRETKGPFEDIDELTEIYGIGEKKLQKFKEYLEVKGRDDEETVDNE